jgi:hypothetical protein
MLGMQKIPNGRPLLVTLTINDGVRIVTTIDGDPEVRTMLPTTQISERTVTVTVEPLETTSAE